MAKIINLTVTTGNDTYISAARVRENYTVDVSLNKDEKYQRKMKLTNSHSRDSEFCQ